MDKKSALCYPVYLISEQYGIRGLDFRAPNNKAGICMIICSAFSKKRARNQALMRVGRFGDACYRIQDSTVEDIDNMQSSIYEGKLLKISNEIAAKQQEVNEIAKQQKQQETRLDREHRQSTDGSSFKADQNEAQIVQYKNKADAIETSNAG